MKEDGRVSIILFDGLCNFCDATVQFIIRRDRGAVFRFAAMQSTVGRDLLRQHGLGDQSEESFILIEEERLYRKSDAALKIARSFPGIWSIVAILYLVPGPLRNRGYDLIARNRYRWFGKKRSCLLPSEDVRSRFLD